MLNFIKKYYALWTGLSVFVVYLFTLAPSVVEIDSGELATVQAKLGIAHPTGYPLFTLLGHLFYLIPLHLRKIYQLNLLTAVWCSLAVMVFVYTSKLVLDNVKEFVPRKLLLQKKPKTINNKTKGKVNRPGSSKYEIPELKKYLGAVFGGLILGFSKRFWIQGTSVETYSFGLFLTNLIILFLLKAYLNKDNPAELKLLNPWLLFAVFLAFGFSNHMTTLFLIPAAAYLYFEKYGFNKISFKRIGLMFVVFIPILILLYSYLPIRAVQNPILNWSNPDTLVKILRHIEANQYHVWLFSSMATAEKQFLYFINNLPSEYLVNSFICIVGIIASFFTARKFFIFTSILFLFTVFYAINYDIHNIDSYFLIAYIALAFFIVFGIVQILKLLKHAKHPYFTSVSLIALFLVVQIYFNFEAVDKSDIFTFEDYTKNILSSCSKNSVLFSYQWDYLVASSYYFQYVENFRTDVTVVDKELLRRSWYYHQLDNNHPKLFSGMHIDVNNFLTALAPFESNDKFDPGLLEACYRKIMTDLVGTNINNADFYIGPELFENEMQRGEFTLPAGYTLVPDLFLFKVVKGSGYIPAPDPNFIIRFPKVRTEYINFIEQTVGSMLARRALYEMQFDKIDRAKIYIRKIKNDLPDYILPPGLADVLET
jgi:hypothetical protein